ncbi:peritrophin-1-like [Pollicipes pollicipes]|nr:peritrophin-1-like [Pollicipes pollicipes]
MDCPANLEFNPVLLVCDWPEHAGCSNKTTPTTPAVSPTTRPVVTTTKKDFDCPTSNGLFPNPKDCHSFYHCSNGYPYLKDCPANLEFNPVLLVCDWPNHAGCGGHPQPTPDYPVTTPVPDDDIVCPNKSCACR